MRHLLGLRRINAATCVALAAGNEGAGSQVLRILSAIAFARALSLTYLHAPFRAIGHADRPMGDWVAAWDQLLNLGAGERHLPDSAGDVPNFDLLFSFGLFPLLGAAQPVLDQPVIDDFRRKYWQNKPAAGDAPPALRRLRPPAPGRCAPHDYPEMWADNAAVAATLAIMRDKLNGCGHDYRIRIFSEGDPAEFAECADGQTQFHLDAIRSGRCSNWPGPTFW